MHNVLKNKYFAYFGAVLCTVLWGTAFPLIKLSYDYFKILEKDVASKLLLAGQRFSMAGIMVLFVGFIFYKKLLIPKKEDFSAIASLALVQTTFQYLFSYIGVGLTTATNTSIISGTASLFSVIIGALVFKSDKLNLFKIIGCVIGFLGIVSVNITELNFASVTFIGDFVILLSAISGAGGNVLSKVVVKRRNVILTTGWQLLLGGLSLLVVGITFGGRLHYSSLKGMLILLWLSFVSAVGFLLWTALLRYHPVSRIAIFNMLVPIFGTIWSGLLLKEDILQWQNLLALVLICAGIIFVNIKGTDIYDKSSNI